VDFFFDTVAAFQAAVETDQVPMWILSLRLEQRWRDLFPFSICDTVVLHFNTLIVGGL
jgi:hypothetical protein